MYRAEWAEWAKSEFSNNPSSDSHRIAHCTFCCIIPLISSLGENSAFSHSPLYIYPKTWRLNNDITLSGGKGLYISTY